MMMDNDSMEELKNDEIDPLAKTFIRDWFKNYIKDVNDYMEKYHLSLEEVVDECKVKTCGLSKSRRDLLLETRPEKLHDLFG